MFIHFVCFHRKLNCIKADEFLHTYIYIYISTLNETTYCYFYSFVMEKNIFSNLKLIITHRYLFPNRSILHRIDHEKRYSFFINFDEYYEIVVIKNYSNRVIFVLFHCYLIRLEFCLDVVEHQ